MKFNWFKKSEPEPEYDFPRLIFTLEGDDIRIEIEWPNSSEDTAIEMGSLISDIVAGNYNTHIYEVLANHVLDHPEYKKFVETLMMAWQLNTMNKVKKQEQLLNQPLVNPLKVFGQSSIFKE